MAYSRVVKKGNGVTTQFTVNFALGYLDPADVTCSVNGVDKPIQFMSANVIKVLGSPVANGLDIIFDRTVNKTALEVDFTDGDILNEENLDRSQKQAVMAVHEVLDGRINLTDNLNLDNFRIVNLANPVGAQDAVTKSYVDTRVADFGALADDISAVAAIDDQIVTVSGMGADITTVNGISSQIATLANNSAVLTGTFAALSVHEYVYTGNGLQTAFQVNPVPLSKEHVDLFVGGAVQTVSDFTITGSYIDINPAPETGAQVIIKIKIQKSSTQLEALTADAQASATAALGSQLAANGSVNSAATFSTSAGNAKVAAETARDNAIAAANATGPVKIYFTKAAANSALAGLANDTVIEVIADESLNSSRTRYVKTSGAYVFLLYMSSLATDALASPLGSGTRFRYPLYERLGAVFGGEPPTPDNSGLYQFGVFNNFTSVWIPGVYNITGSWINGPRGPGSFAYSGLLVVRSFLNGSRVWQDLYIGNQHWRKYYPAGYPSSGDPWREIATEIVGIVSNDADGYARGAIIERGVSGNEEYTRFADGTQISTTTIIESGGITTPTGSNFRSAEQTWTFVKPFIATPSVHGKVRSGPSHTWIGHHTTGDSATAAYYGVYAGAGAGSGCIVALTATGRWF